MVITITSIVEKTDKNTVNNVITITITVLTQPAYLFKCYSSKNNISNNAIIIIPTNNVIKVVINLKKNLFKVCIPICPQNISSYLNPLYRCKFFFSSTFYYSIEIYSYSYSFKDTLFFLLPLCPFLHVHRIGYHHSRKQKYRGEVSVRLYSNQIKRNKTK